ncbi:MAG: hypothetical protein ACLRFE_02390, partial [Clostridia bacterium]
GGNMENKTIQHYLTSSTHAYAIVDGNYNPVHDLNELNNVIENMLIDSHTMPALGVSIHAEILQAVQHGVWIKLQYPQPCEVDGMQFDELLIEVNSEFGGFNIVRGNKGIYDGRCFYINLDKDMHQLSDWINQKF